MGKQREGLERLRRAFGKRLPAVIMHGGGVSDLLPIGDRYGTLSELFAEHTTAYDMPLYYDIARGFTFPDNVSEQKFRKAVGLDDSPSVKPKESEKFSVEKQAELHEAIDKLKLPGQKPIPYVPPSLAFILVSRMAGGCERKTIGLLLPHGEKLAPASATESLDDRMTSVSLARLMGGPDAPTAGSTIILTTDYPADLAPAIRHQRGVEVIELPLPDTEEREAYLAWRMRREKKEFGDVKELARLTGGLALRDIELLIRKDMLKADLLFREKSRILKESLGDLVVLKEPRWGFRDGLGGLEEVKAYFTGLIPGLKRMDPRIVPPGIILMGPPGTGKSALAECLAWEIGVPFVEILSLYDPFVGQSERNAQRLMATLSSLAPCVAFVDEADQNEAPRGSFVGDSGVGNRVRKIQFETMGDQQYRGKIVWLQATNMPNLLDPAYKRSGRGSVRVPMLLPGDEEARDILRVMKGRYDLPAANKDFGAVVRHIRNMHGERCISGADIEEISLAAFRGSAARNAKTVTLADWREAVEDFVPHEEPEKGPCDYRLMEIAAVRGRSSNRLLSERGRQILEEIE